MRKTSLNMVYELAQKDERVLFIGSDLGPGVLDEFKKNVGDVMRELKSTKGIYNREVFVPGEKEYLYSEKVNKKGIEVGEKLMKELEELGWKKWKQKHTTRSLK